MKRFAIESAHLVKAILPEVVMNQNHCPENTLIVQVPLNNAPLLQRDNVTTFTAVTWKARLASVNIFVFTETAFLVSTTMKKEKSVGTR